jgi:hypothetical protein
VAVADAVGALLAVVVDVASGVGLGEAAVVPAHAATKVSARARRAIRMRDIMNAVPLRPL